MSSDSSTALVVRDCALDGPLILEPAIYRDDRGSFRELFNAELFEASTGIVRQWSQDSHSNSKRNVLRGIHYQMDPLQGKLVSCTGGKIFDVAVDLRRSSPTFGRWIGTILSEENGHQFWVPEGFGHGYLVLSAAADVLYKFTTAHNPTGYRSVAWDDPDLGIAWPVSSPPTMSVNDRTAPTLDRAELFP